MFFCSGVKDTNGRIEVLSGEVKKVLDSTASNNIVENRLLEGNNITISYINEQYHQNPGHGHGLYQGADLEFFVDVSGRRGGKFELSLSPQTFMSALGFMVLVTYYLLVITKAVFQHLN